MSQAQQPTWSTKLMQTLWSGRPAYCDVEIECTANKDKVYVHRCVLAARTAYFQQAFSGHAQGGSPDGGAHTMVVQPHADDVGQSPGERLNNVLDTEHDASHASHTANQRLRRTGKVIFRESSDMLNLIIEFMYLGQIDMLEEYKGNPTESQCSLWLWLLTWGFKHKVLELFTYIVAHLLRLPLPPQLAAMLMDLQIGSVGATDAAVSAGVEEQDRDVYIRMLDHLRAHAAATFSQRQFSQDIFAPLNHSSLVFVLQNCQFNVSEVEVMKAVQRWVQTSEWVQATYHGAMPDEEVFRLMENVDLRCLTPHEALLMEKMFLPAVIDKFIDDMYALHDKYPNRPRMADSPVCENRASIRAYYAPVAMPVDTSSASMRPAAPPQPAAARPRPPEQGPMLQEMRSLSDRSRQRDPPAPAPKPEAPAPLNKALSNAETLKEVATRARSDPSKPASSFSKGTKMFLTYEKGNRYLISLESSTYQGLRYKGYVQPGVFKWALEVVRACDMFWMGVTSNPQLDMSNMIARDHHVWMVSEEGTCMEHCRGVAVNALQSIKARINLLFVDTFKCLREDLGAWSKVVMELNTSTGDLHMTINGSSKLHVFQRLPRDKPLYPCVMAVNTGQAHFELVEARQL